jgi:hypothetical protein
MDPIEAVIEALQRHQGGAFLAAEATLRVEHVVGAEVMRGSLQRRVQYETTGDSSQARITQDSPIKARYASTVLRVAQVSDRKTAARLVAGLAHDYPHQNERPETVDIHLCAIDAFSELAAALGDPTTPKPQHLWNNALATAREWLSAVSGRQ